MSDDSAINDERFLVSGWEDDLSGIEETRNPVDELERNILEASEDGNLDKVKELVESRVDLLHVTDNDRYTPLHRACYSNNLDVVKYLLEKGANVGAETEMKWQPLHSCCQWNSVRCAATLIQNNADVNAASQGGQTPLHIAASHGSSYETVQLLLMDPYVNPKLKNNQNETAREIAMRSSRYYNIFDMVDPLLDYKNIELLS